MISRGDGPVCIVTGGSAMHFFSLFTQYATCLLWRCCGQHLR